MPEVKTQTPEAWTEGTNALTRKGSGEAAIASLMPLGSASAQPVAAFEPTVGFVTYSSGVPELAVGDNRQFLRFTAAEVTLNIPLDASTPFPDGFLCWGTFSDGGTITCPSGASINGDNAASVTVGAERDGAGFTLRRDQANVWILTLGSSAQALGELLEDDTDGFVGVLDGAFVKVPYLESAGAANRFWTNDASGNFYEVTYAEARTALGVYPHLPLTSVSAAKTFTLAEANQGDLHPSADTTARIWTIPANASVALPVGSFFTFINEGSAGIITIAITSDTLVWSPTGGTGSRALAPYGMATAFKKTATSWIISGSGLT